MSNGELVDILKRRNIKHVCYFHTDHYEPWSKGVNENTAHGVNRFSKLSKETRFAAEMNLFYHTFLPFRLDQEIVKRNESGMDAIFLGGRTAQQDAIIQQVMTPLVQDGGHEVHIHVHHESWTRNTGEYSKDISRWVNQNSTEEMDRARLERALLITKDYIGRDIGKPIDKWAFVHGNWALNGSDRSICWINDEIEILMRHGCFGDFTFPAGRGHCNPTVLIEPYTCLAVNQPKGYDLPESLPLKMERGLTPFRPDRFFIWSSVIKADYSSLDYYSEQNRETFKNTENVVANWLEKSVIVGETLYIKTHAHSMKWEYEIEKNENPIPHLYPDIKNIFKLLETICERAGVEVEVVTVNTLMKRLQEYVKAAEAAEAITVKQTPLEAAVESLGEAMTAWLDGSQERDHAAGDFYKVRINAGRWLEDYEMAVVKHVITKYDTATTRITEIGIGLGTLTAVLAALGYRTYGIEGDLRRSAGAMWIKNFLAEQYPEIEKNYVIVKGFYPEMFSGEFIADDKHNIVISTNLVHTFSAQNQDKILKSFLMFDSMILDSSRFGISRGGAEKVADIENMLWRHFVVVDKFFHSVAGSLTEFSPRDPLSFNQQTCGTLVKFPEVLKLSTDVCHNWLKTLNDQGASDAFIADKLERGQVIDKREVAVVEQICRMFRSTETRIVEVGSACGALALLLAVQGFEVVGFEGNVRRAKAAEIVKSTWLSEFSESPVVISFHAQLFPKQYSDSLLSRTKQNVLLTTNIVGTYSAEHQSQLLAAAANFSDVIIDIGRFGISRDTADQRATLLRAMASTFFEPIEPIFFNNPNECWHFRVRKLVD
jgi:hypothetical protein